MVRMICRSPRPNLPRTNWQFFHENRWKSFNRETNDMIERAIKGGV
jgi:hypothetical protein